jgi:hypothetical protein
MAKAAAKKSDVVVPNQNALAFSNEAPAYLNQGTARGSEEVTSKDMVLPRLEIVQATSPIKETDESIRDGHLFNSVTQEVIGDLAYFVPVYFRLEYLIWKDQDTGGGFFGSYPSEAEAKARYKEVVEDDPTLAGQTKDGKPILEIVDTPVQYGMRITPEGEFEQIVISMAKSKSKVSRKWNAMIQIAGGDRFSRVYKISTFTDENKQGKKFKNFVVQPAGFTPEKVYREAERLYEVLKTQEFRVAHDTVINNGEDGPAEGTTSGGDRGGI